MIGRHPLLSSTLKASLPALFVLAMTQSALGAQECGGDADCGEYLSCATSVSTTCSDSGDGLICETSDLEAPKYCSIPIWTCSTDADCPRQFECVTHESVCPDIACEEGTPPERCRPCEPKSSQLCQPRQIECQDDGECPEAWSCVGGGDVPVVSDPDVPVGDTAEERRPPPESTGARHCLPAAWSADATDDVSGSTTDLLAEDADAEAASAGGGCSVGRGNLDGATGFWLSLPLLAAFRRRRTVKA